MDCILLSEASLDIYIEARHDRIFPVTLPNSVCYSLNRHTEYKKHMSTFNNGGGTLKSTTKPAGFLEIAHLINEAERTASTVDLTLDNVTITYDTGARTATVDATLPIGSTVNSSGQIVISAANYLGASAFNPGTAGEIKGSTFPAAFLEAAQLLASSEQSVTPTPPNNISISFDLEALTATVTATLPVLPSLDSAGKPVFTATDYLP